MNPNVTLLTSTELQELVENPLSDADMQRLRTYRNTLQDQLQEYVDALGIMEDLYGQQWQSLDIAAWVFDTNHDHLSSPILIPVMDEDDGFFLLMRLLATRLIRENAPDSKLIDPGYDKLDAVATLLARRSLKRVMPEEAYNALIDEARSSGEDMKMWRAADDFGARWDDTTPMHDWLEAQG